MVTLGNQEETLIDALVTCLSIAADRSDVASASDFNETKTQKFIYFAIDEFDLPVTYSWYLAGSLVESESISTPGSALSSPDSPTVSPDRPTVSDDLDEYSDVADADDDTSSSPEFDAFAVDSDIEREFELESEHDSRFATDDDIEVSGTADDISEMASDLTEADRTEINAMVEFPDSVDVQPADVVYLYQEKLTTYPLHPTDRFLQQFYKYHAPERFRSLYESCLHLRSAIRALALDVQALVDGERTTIDVEGHDDTIGQYVSEVHFELYENDQLNETADYVVRGTDLIEDAVLKLMTMETVAITEAQADAIERIQDFYFNVVWKLPALKISAETATGPSRNEITEARTDQYESFETQFTERLAAMRAHLDDVGLVPEVDDYPAPERTELDEAVAELHNYYTVDNP